MEEHAAALVSHQLPLREGVTYHRPDGRPFTLTVTDRGLLAQDEGGEAGVIYQKKTIVNFDEDTIDGDLTRPDAAYVESRKRVRHSNLIRIREDFREKILSSVTSL